MKAIYDKKPSKIEAVGNGSYLYRFNIQEIASDTENNERYKSWSCDEVTVWAPISSNKITEKVISDTWNANYEQKAINEYNAAQLGMYGDITGEEAQAKINAYKQFLEAREEIKKRIDEDCSELGIR